MAKRKRSKQMSGSGAVELDGFARGSISLDELGETFQLGVASGVMLAARLAPPPDLRRVAEQIARDPEHPDTMKLVELASDIADELRNQPTTEDLEHGNAETPSTSTPDARTTLFAGLDATRSGRGNRTNDGRKGKRPAAGT